MVNVERQIKRKERKQEFSTSDAMYRFGRTEIEKFKEMCLRKGFSVTSIFLLMRSYQQMTFFSFVTSRRTRVVDEAIRNPPKSFPLFQESPLLGPQFSVLLQLSAPSEFQPWKAFYDYSPAIIIAFSKIVPFLFLYFYIYKKEKWKTYNEIWVPFPSSSCFTCEWCLFKNFIQYSIVQNW